MAETTITEALAELKTIAKRIDKKREFVMTYIGRVAMNRDPLEKEGGAVQAVASERQAIKDLQERTVAIRRAISRANDSNKITVGSSSRSISDWLVWRREVAPLQKSLLESIRSGINNARNEAKKRDSRIVQSESEVTDSKDIIIHLSESELAREIEDIETVLGTLDGQLSLKNATVTIQV